MYKRAIFLQTCQISTRNLACSVPAVTTRRQSLSLLKSANVRQLRPSSVFTSPQPPRRFYSNEAEAATGAEAKTDTPKATNGEQVENNIKDNEELANLTKELEAKTKEAKDYKDKYTRTIADFRNFQDRAEREKKSARDFAIQKFAKDLVDSVDNLDRALGAVPEEARADAENNKELIDLYNGLKMTEKILLNTLQKHGLEKFDPLGEVFDPNKHEATFQVPIPDKEPNTVFQVQQTGFILNGRTIRAAKVGVVAQAPDES